MDTLIKRKIDLEPYIDRRYDSPTWGAVTADSFYVKVILTQNIDDTGLFTDALFVPTGNTSNLTYEPLKQSLINSGYTFPFMSGIKPNMNTALNENELISLRLPSKKLEDYYYFINSKIVAGTDSKIEGVRSYNILNPFRINFNTKTEQYTNYNNEVVDGVDRIKTMGEPSIYVFDTLNDENLGTENQVYGLRYLDYSGLTREVLIDGVTEEIPLTTVDYIGEGWNSTNTSLFASVKEEFLFGITSVLPTESDLFIDRGATNVMDMHLRMSEVKNLSQLESYGNGFFKLNKQ